MRERTLLCKNADKIDDLVILLLLAAKRAEVDLP